MTGDEAQRPSDDGAEGRIALIEESLSVRKRQVETGRVRVQVHVEEREQPVEIDLWREDVEVRRVPVGRQVDVVPETRQEGDTLIVPVVEEEVVVTRRLVLREEIHLTRRRHERTERRSVTLRAEQAEVMRDGPPPRSHQDEEDKGP
ncbi:YsnF/AvaK domain-containing protein [Arenibaculum pallidiluteum]|uniref:YsnF/AvaK domain-containing protein n=1 Tax=Arenibaculum pallidiluteum TaxID=2812559 RepID=UPI002E2CBF8E|nr:DUF2382 domain-containing protein [Arenibaculum pallidiluteum]